MTEPKLGVTRLLRRVGWNHPHHETAWSLILAGGDGTRLQDLTRRISGRPIPKQYCRIHGDRSLLETTIERVAPLSRPERRMAIVNRNHLELATRQLTGVPAPNIVIQPSNRDTGPGLLLALLELHRRDPDACVAVYPSDHYVADADRFRFHVERAHEVVRRRPRSIALIGIKPESPDPGFGYILRGESLHLSAVGRAFDVTRFVEKPSIDDARHIIAGGGLWNSFVMVFHVARMLELVASERPSDFLAMTSLLSKRLDDDAYSRLPAWNFSADFLSRIADTLVVIEADKTGWNDWGTREAIERTLADLDIIPSWMTPPVRDLHARPRPRAA